jgi:hypothetical protein
VATAEQFLDEARKYLGVTEAPADSNCQPFSKALGRPCEAWCADFVAYCAKEVGLALPSTSAYTPTMADGFRLAHQWTHDPQPGYIGFVDFPGDNTYGIQHVLIVERVLGTEIQTIEGNTTPGDAGVQDNGGGVYRRVRPMLWIVGYGIPPLAAAPPWIGQGATINDEEAEMVSVVDRPQGGYLVVQHDGGVFAEDGAPFLGSIPQHPEIKLGGNIVGAAWTPSGQGYWLVGRDGGVFSFGDAAYHGGLNAESPETRGARYAVGIAAEGGGYKVITFDPSNDGTPYDAYAYGV